MDTSALTLIIEDNRNITDLVRRYLVRAGFERAMPESW